MYPIAVVHYIYVGFEDVKYLENSKILSGLFRKVLIHDTKAIEETYSSFAFKISP